MKCEGRRMNERKKERKKKKDLKIKINNSVMNIGLYLFYLFNTKYFFYILLQYFIDKKYNF